MFKLCCTQTRAPKARKRKFNYKNCRHCGCTEIFRSGPDQFCTKCDWNTCLEYVERGYMNNLTYAYNDHFPKAKKEKIPTLPVGEAPMIKSPDDEKQSA